MSSLSFANRDSTLWSIQPRHSAGDFKAQSFFIPCGESRNSRQWIPACYLRQNLCFACETWSLCHTQPVLVGLWQGLRKSCTYLSPALCLQSEEWWYENGHFASKSVLLKLKRHFCTSCASLAWLTQNLCSDSVLFLCYSRQTYLSASAYWKGPATLIVFFFYVKELDCLHRRYSSPIKCLSWSLSRFW